MLPIDPTSAVGDGQWQIGGVGGLSPSEATVDPTVGQNATGATSPTGFGDALTTAIDKLGASQDAATAASQSLADGTATDPTAVVMSVEKAQLSMQLASQLRTRGVEALNTIFQTQV